MAETEQAQEEQTETQTEGQEQSSQTEVNEAEFAEAQDVGDNPDGKNLDILLDISMPISVNIGSTEVPFKRLLQLGPGSILQLDKHIGQPAELYVQDIKFATGDIVVVEGCFAVRIKEVMAMDHPGESTEE